MTRRTRIQVEAADGRLDLHQPARRWGQQGPWLDVLAGDLEDQPPSGWTGPARRREQELEAEVRELRRQLHEARQAEQHWRAVARLEDCEVSEDDCEWLRGALKKGGEG